MKSIELSTKAEWRHAIGRRIYPIDKDNEKGVKLKLLAVWSWHRIEGVNGENSLESELRAYSRRGVADYWSMAVSLPSMSSLSLPSVSSLSSLVNATLPGVSASITSASDMANALYNNPDLAPLFKEMPNLLDELRTLDKEQISNMLFLFRMYTAIPIPLRKFFHMVISRIKSIAPMVRDVAKFSIAAELTKYVQSATNPAKGMFSSVSNFMPRLSTRALSRRAPSWGGVARTVGKILLKNIGVPPPLIPFNILRHALTELAMAYMNGDLKMPDFPKLPFRIEWRPLKDVISPKRSRAPRPKAPASPSPPAKE